MSTKRPKQQLSTTPILSNKQPPTKKQKLNFESRNELLSNTLDLDLNLVMDDKNKTPLNINLYTAKKTEIKIDDHLIFQFNEKKNVYNLKWVNKSVMDFYKFRKLQNIIKRKSNHFCHFVQPSFKEIFQLFINCPKVIQESKSCITILHNIHKSVMSVCSERNYAQRDRKVLDKVLINITFKSKSLKEQLLSKQKFNYISDDQKYTSSAIDLEWNLNIQQSPIIESEDENEIKVEMKHMPNEDMINAELFFAEESDSDSNFDSAIQQLLGNKKIIENEQKTVPFCDWNEFVDDYGWKDNEVMLLYLSAHIFNCVMFYSFMCYPSNME